MWGGLRGGAPGTMGVMPDRTATASNAQRAAARAAARALATTLDAQAASAALKEFTRVDAKPSLTAPAGWPSTCRDAKEAARRAAEQAALRSQSMLTPMNGGAFQAPAGGKDHSKAADGAGALHSAPSHLLVARALGPVAGRAVVTERRQLLDMRDAAEARCLELESQLEESHGLLPESRGREVAAMEREVQARRERDDAHGSAEAARRETAQVRATLDAERARADRAEAARDELRIAAAAELSAVREQLEATQADWRCAEAEVRRRASLTPRLSERAAKTEHAARGACRACQASSACRACQASGACLMAALLARPQCEALACMTRLRALRCPLLTILD